MTREEFMEESQHWDWADALSYADEVDFGHDDLMDADTFDECVEEDVSNRDCSWNELRDYLNDVPSWNRDSYYRKDYWLEYVEMDEEDLSDFISELEEYCTSNELFDEPAPEEEEEYPESDIDFFDIEEEAPADPTDFEVEDCDMSAFVIGCRTSAEKCTQEPEEEESEVWIENDFIEYISGKKEE